MPPSVVITSNLLENSYHTESIDGIRYESKATTAKIYNLSKHVHVAPNYSLTSNTINYFALQINDSVIIKQQQQLRLVCLKWWHRQDRERKL